MNHGFELYFRTRSGFIGTRTMVTTYTGTICAVMWMDFSSTKMGGGSLLCWGAIYLYGVYELVLLNGNMD